MTTQPDRLREAATAILGECEEVIEYQHGSPLRVIEAIAERCRTALAEAAPAPDLLAAVEALPGHDAWNTGVTRGDYVDRAAVLDLIESRPTSREAGLDAERLAEAIRVEGRSGRHDGMSFVRLAKFESLTLAALLAAEYARLASATEWRVHNHGPEEGRGVSCREYHLNGRLVGGCLIAAATSREAGLDAEAVTGAARDMRVTADDIYGAIRDLGRAGSRAEAIVFACAEAIAARLAASPVPAEKPEQGEFLLDGDPVIGDDS